MLSSYANDGIFDAVFGTLMILFAAVWIWAEFQIVAKKIRGFFHRLLGTSPDAFSDASVHVDETLAAMYGIEDAKYRKAAHAQRENGGKHA